MINGQPTTLFLTGNGLGLQYGNIKYSKCGKRCILQSWALTIKAPIIDNRLSYKFLCPAMVIYKGIFSFIFPWVLILLSSSSPQQKKIRQQVTILVEIRLISTRAGSQQGNNNTHYAVYTHTHSCYKRCFLVSTLYSLLSVYRTGGYTNCFYSLAVIWISYKLLYILFLIYVL